MITDPKRHAWAPSGGQTTGEKNTGRGKEEAGWASAVVRTIKSREGSGRHILGKKENPEKENRGKEKRKARSIAAGRSQSLRRSCGKQKMCWCCEREGSPVRRFE